MLRSFKIAGLSWPSRLDRRRRKGFPRAVALVALFGSFDNPAWPAPRPKLARRTATDAAEGAARGAA
jgi:hypothetical protein